jgi:hypothetical protein
MSRRWLVLVAVALGLVTVIAAPVLIRAATTDCHLFSVDESSYTAENRAVLEDVPLFPGSTFINTGSMAEQYQDRCIALGDNGPPYAGFRTYVNYETPSSAGPQDVLNFYNRYFAAQGWRSESALYPGVAGSTVTYENGTRRVTMRVVLQGYSLTADHDTTD